MDNFLEFEKPIEELSAKIEELEKLYYSGLNSKSYNTQSVQDIKNDKEMILLAEKELKDALQNKEKN